MRRAVAFQLPGLVAEFELLLDLTVQPGERGDGGPARTLDKYKARDGLANALRVTPTTFASSGERPPSVRRKKATSGT